MQPARNQLSYIGTRRETPGQPEWIGRGGAAALLSPRPAADSVGRGGWGCARCKPGAGGGRPAPVPVAPTQPPPVESAGPGAPRVSGAMRAGKGSRPHGHFPDADVAHGAALYVHPHMAKSPGPTGSLLVAPVGTAFAGWHAPAMQDGRTGHRHGSGDRNGTTHSSGRHQIWSRQYYYYRPSCQAAVLSAQAPNLKIHCASSLKK